jgi:hypothetical protein
LDHREILDWGDGGGDMTAALRVAAILARGGERTL